MPPNTESAAYDFKTDTKQRISAIIRRADNASIPVDQITKDFCKFLFWAAQQNPPVISGANNTELVANYFINEGELIEYCKQHSIIFARDPSGTGQPQLLTDSDGSGIRHATIAIPFVSSNGTLDHHRFYRLSKVIPKKDAQVNDEADGLEISLSGIIVPHCLYEKLNNDLTNTDSDIRSLSNWPVEKTFVYVDISGFSQHPTGHQLLILNSLIDLINDKDKWLIVPPGQPQNLPSLAMSDLESNLCIGDGYIFVFKSPWAAVYFSGYLANLIEKLIANRLMTEFHFRMSVHTGLVYRFWDKWGPKTDQGRWNYVGKGITEGERVLSAIGKEQDDVVFISGKTREEILRLSDSEDPRDSKVLLTFLHNRGRRSDKHNILRRLYELNHTGWLGNDVLIPGRGFAHFLARSS